MAFQRVDRLLEIEFEITCAWDGSPLVADESARLVLRADEGRDLVELGVEARYFGDAAPGEGPGRLDGLWEFEVVELFLLGRDEHYLEIELGPHGHWLALALEGRREVIDASVPIGFDASIRESRWRGRAQIPRSALPPGLDRANAYAIHGMGASRRYLAMTPVPGPHPDFHRLECFEPIPRIE